MLTLILGGVRSGKSRMAERLAADISDQIVYVATAEAKDVEMQERIALHQTHRPEHWKTIEEPIHLAKALFEYGTAENVVIVDCITLWITNLLLADERFKTELKRGQHNLVLVSNETNSGVVPMDALSRRFCDEIGVLHQRLAALADNVILMVAGIPTWVKQTV